MTNSIATAWHELSVQDELGVWQLRSMHPDDLMPGPLCLRVDWRLGGQGGAWCGPSNNVYTEVDHQRATPLGRAVSLIVDSRSVKGELGIKVVYALCEDPPLFLWRTSLTNRSSEAVFLDRLVLLQTIEGDDDVSVSSPKSGSRTWSPRRYDRMQAQGVDDARWAFYCTGWQSWTFAGTLTPQQRMPRTRLGLLTEPVQVSHGTQLPRRTGFFSSDMFGVVASRKTRRGLLAGFLSQERCFGAFDVCFLPRGASMRLWLNGDGVRLDPGHTFESDWACLQFVDLDAADPLETYLDSVEKVSGSRADGDTPAGWCSWYQYFQGITQADVLRSMHWAQEHRTTVPLDVLQIDDGFQAEVGDWLEWDHQSFPLGMDQLADEIERVGFKAGLWLAPFIAKPGASVLAEHEDWILRRPNGKPSPAGYLWDTFPRALDVTHPEVQEHLRKVMYTVVHEWGYRYLKLDFLYAGALPGERFDPTKTRAQALRGALELIREVAGEDAVLVGCGCPLGSGVGIFDSMRIGPDVATHWLPEYRGLGFLLRSEPGLPSCRNAIQTSLARAHLHGRWWANDPDCILLRDSDTSLTPSEVQTLATVVSLSGGAMMVSDDLGLLSKKRVSWLQRLLPLLPKAARVVDLFDSQPPSILFLPLRGSIGNWWLIAAINWLDSDADLEVSPNVQGHLELPDVSAHGVRFLALREHGAHAQWVGDTLHTSQGLGVKNVERGERHLQFAVDYQRALRGRVWLKSPAGITQIAFEGEPQPWHQITEDVYCVDLDFPRGGKLLVRWN